MYQQSNGSSTLPRGFRFHHNEEPKTPEPQEAIEPQMPSPPRQRLRVRRRNASSTFSAPTQQFLASVAAEDIPVPTIEEPCLAQTHENCVMMGMEQTPLSLQTRFLTPELFRAESLPKTPAPKVAIEDGHSQQRPDWAAGSISPAQYYFTREVSSFSTPGSECSDDSFYSGSRISRPSDDGSCTSPEESEMGDPFEFQSLRKRGKGRLLQPSHFLQSATMLNSKLHRKRRTDAPWTEAQSNHLWSTYLLYLSDPTVTPFRIGYSAVPPQGIVRRVAREAKRSWKGPKAAASVPVVRRSTRLNISSVESGSSTPTAENPRTYGQWPHSSNLTRSRLRELCKKKNHETNPVQVHHHFQSRSPTPFTRADRRLASITSSFDTSDIALSLTTSTAPSMQPDGPLAQLAASAHKAPLSCYPLLEEFKPVNFGNLIEPLPSAAAGPKLGSPFLARSYGPSSSKSTNFGPSLPRSRSDTVVEQRPHLGSPVRFDHSRSLNGTMKRRAQHSLDEELGPHGAVVRPSILNDQLISDPISDHRRRVRSRGFTMGDEGLLNRVPGLFHRQADVPALPSLPLSFQTEAAAAPPAQLLPAPVFSPARLGSPFSEAASGTVARNTFPKRLLQDSQATIRKSAFKTMHQTRRSIESFDFGEGPSLQSRLSHLDQRLKEIKERESSSRTHEQKL
ncbi:hypothetical protein BJ878DRAFT_69156 [Calycina marina]|uniref:Uncharacterized protein n=1 Tax=Calycina marina TaxID=1763456 RepID=A0A9P8CES8_9HELO|nr:hypothetical protein BJ878DRAFT_69156 [Calycina marina]